MIENFLFDLYGTLVDIRTDEESAEFWDAAARLIGGSAEEVKADYCSLCAERGDREREFDLLAVFCALKEKYACPLSPDELAHAFRAASMRKFCLYPGARELLARLGAVGKVYLLSNAQACFTRAELASLQISEAFDGILLSSEAGRKKPSVHFFRAALDRFGLSPEQCVYIGNDLRDDVQGAENAGIRSVYIETEQSGHYPGLPRARTEVSSLEELANLLVAMARES